MSPPSPKDILLITSTIAPRPDVFSLVRTDPRQRLEDYRHALALYVESLRRRTFSAIVFVDNSGHPLDALRAEAEKAGVGDRCEFVSFASEGAANVSRFFLEAQLLVEAAARSKVLAEASMDIIWKVTGRYRIGNIDAIVRSRPPQCDLYINCRDHPHRVCDFFLVAFSRRAFDRMFAGGLEDYRTTESGEEILRRKIDADAFGDISVVKRFKRTPRVAGVRGFDGARYDSPSHMMKHYVRIVANRAAPWLWI